MTEYVSELGRPRDRIDGDAKVRGRARFAADIALPGLAYAVIVTSTIPSGNIRSIDVQYASKSPGVLGILSHHNARRLHPAPPSRPFFLQSDRVCYDGEPIAVVIAGTQEEAEYAAGLVRASYDPKRSATSFVRARRDAATPATVAMDVLQPADSSRGDVDAGVRAAVAVVAQTYATPTHNHNQLEPHAVVAAWNTSRLTIYTGTQGVSWAQELLARAFELSESDVHVVSHFTGGGFGGKALALYPTLALCADAARLVRRPVRLVLSRPAMFTMTGRRALTDQHVTVAADRSGRLTALRHDVVAESSLVYDFCDSTAFSTRSIYACPNVSISHRIARMNVPFTVSMRGPGDSVGMFALESALDELAHEMKIDPVELRRRNYTSVDAHTGQPWSSNSLLRCYELGAQRFGWARRTPEPRSMGDADHLIGWGMATLSFPQFTLPAKAQARLYPNGSAVVRAASQELGNGNTTVMQQVAAEALGLDMKRVRFESGDSTFPRANPSVGSMTTGSLAPAVFDACATIRKQILDLAIAEPDSPMSGLRARDLTIRGGYILSRSDSSRSRAIADIMRASGTLYLEATGSSAPGDEFKRYAIRSFGAHFVEVRVDRATCEPRVHRVVTVTAIGRVLNAKLARSQLIGGVVFGIGQALMEETVMDERTGRVVTKSLADYHFPTDADIPDIETVFVDERDDHVSAVGAKTLGMNGAVGSAAAIANAVYHATGVRVRKLPITVEKLL